jgi:radical SAM protein with 4Fe4S-binding SPASM domain
MGSQDFTNTIRLISWNLTRRCNLACGHCYLDARQRRDVVAGEADTTEALQRIRDLAAAAPGAMVVLTGGEPLLRRDLEELVRAAADGGLVPVVGSNGVLLDKRRAVSLKDAGAAGIGISVDSTVADVHDAVRGKKGAWSATLAGIAMARSVELPVLVQSTLFERNRHEVADLVNLARAIGAAAINFFFLVCTGRGATQTDISPAAYEEALRKIIELQEAHTDILIRARCAPYIRRLKGLRAGESRDSFADWSSSCLAGRSYIRITPEGQVTPCPYIQRAVGDLRAESLESVLSASEDIRRLRGERPAGKCGRCDWRLSCGGCRARALAAGGDLMAEDPKCTYVPGPETAPETLSVAAPPAGAVLWCPAALDRLARIPSFVRERVRERLEKRATEAGLTEITPEFMQSSRPSWMRGGRPQFDMTEFVPPHRR